MNAESMIELYVSELQDMLSAEEQLIKTLPRVIEKSSSRELAGAFRDHLAQTREHSARLREILTRLERKTGGEHCKAMEGLLNEGAETLKAKGSDEVRDAGIIVAAQKIEHYEIAGYGCLCAFAKILGRADDASLLKMTLDEEHAADQKLTELAENEINAAAAR